jgi:hypothetical protein
MSQSAELPELPASTQPARRPWVAPLLMVESADHTEAKFFSDSEAGAYGPSS